MALASFSRSSSRSSHPSPDASGGGPYRALLALPGARAQFAAGLIARLPMSMLGIGSLLLVTATTGSYGVAGAICAAIAIANAAATPRMSRLVDRLGARSVLSPLTVAHVLAGGAFVAGVVLRAPTAALIALALATGATQPQVGAVSRRRWAARLTDADALRGAYALETVVDETVFVIGPALATTLAGVAAPAGVAASLVFAAVGVPAFAFLPVRQSRAGEGGEAGRSGGATTTTATATTIETAATTATAAAVHGEPGAGGRGRTVVRHPGMPMLVATFVGVGAVFGSCEVALVAVGRAHGLRAAAGALPVLLTITSLAMSVIYGSVRWRAALPRRLALAGAALAAAAAPLPAGGGLLLPAVCAAALGAPIACVLIGGNTLVGRIVPPERGTEGFAWLAIATSLGVAVASPLTGQVVDLAGPRAGTMVISAAAVWVALAAAGLARGPRRDASPAWRAGFATAHVGASTAVRHEHLPTAAEAAEPSPWSRAGS